MRIPWTKRLRFRKNRKRTIIQTSGETSEISVEHNEETVLGKSDPHMADSRQGR